MSEPYNFDEMTNRRGTDSLKWDYFDKFIIGASKDALPLWVADMDFPVAEPIMDALRQCLDRKIFGYSFYKSPAYVEAVTGWFKRQFQWEIDPDSIYYSPGVVPAIAILIRVLTQPGDAVVIQRPVYYPFTDKIQGNGREVLNNPLKIENGRYVMDFEDLEEKLSRHQTKGMILCSPHNPVGRVWTAEELIAVVGLCKKYDKWIISDEIHGDLLRRDIIHHSLEALCPDYKNQIITCTAPSKTFNLAGMQLSNIILNNPDYRSLWTAEIDGALSVGLSNPFAIVATIAAYNEGEPWLKQLLDYLEDNISFLKSFVAEHLPKVHVFEPEGTYLVWLDFRAYETDPVRLEDLVLKQAKVVLDEGYFFGDEGNGFERINIACPRQTLEDALVKIAAVFRIED